RIKSRNVVRSASARKMASRAEVSITISAASRARRNQELRREIDHQALAARQHAARDLLSARSKPACDGALLTSPNAPQEIFGLPLRRTRPSLLLPVRLPVG